MTLYNKDNLILDYISHGLTKAFHEINCVRTDSLTAGQNITKGEYDEL